MQFSLTAVSILIIGSLALVGIALISLIVLIIRDSKNKNIW